MVIWMVIKSLQRNLCNVFNLEKNSSELMSDKEDFSEMSVVYCLKSEGYSVRLMLHPESNRPSCEMQLQDNFPSSTCSRCFCLWAPYSGCISFSRHRVP